MRANIYIRKINEPKWESLADKSAWVNMLLDGEAIKARVPIISAQPNRKAKLEIKPLDELLKELPNTTRASEAKCKGQHFMFRQNCGKPDCPWA